MSRLNLTGMVFGAVLLLTSGQSALQAASSGPTQLSSEEVYQLVPHEWVAVDKVGGKLVIQTYCDAHVETLGLVKHEGDIKLYHATGQDSDLYTVLGGTKHDTYIEIKARVEYRSEEPLETIKVVFSNPEWSVAKWTFSYYDFEQLFMQGIEGGEREDTVLDIPILPPEDDCSRYM